MDRHDPNYVEDAPFAVVNVDDLQGTEHGRALLAQLERDGVQIVTTAEQRFLKEWSWGPDAHRETCVHCGEVMVFEKHPADWPNHPGDPGDVRVKIECPKCGGTQFTDGEPEAAYVAELQKRLMAEVMEEVARRLTEAHGEPVVIEHISGSEGGGAAEHGTVAAAPAPPAE